VSSATEPPARHDYDVIVVGSGFGGSVAALRLSEKGYRVAVLEAGARMGPECLPRNSWHVRRFLWAPLLGCYGVQRIHFLKDVVVLAGAGVGGGSLNYANTLYEPPPGFFSAPQWPCLPDGRDWAGELSPYYGQARRMLGATINPFTSPADEAMKRVAQEMGCEGTFRSAPVGVFFGPKGTKPGAAVPDPFFGGAGPGRRTCCQCGECMTGCRHGAKNTLLTNYLYLAERAGAVVIPMTTVKALAPIDAGGWSVEAVSTGFPWRPRRLSAGHVVLSAGTYGTQQLLHSMAASGKLPRLSPALGRFTRTNSESLLGAVAPSVRPGTDYSRGVAITSSFSPQPGTHVEPVRYGHGSNLMGLFGTLLVERPSPARWLAKAVRHPWELISSLALRRWSERTIIALVMQVQDNSLALYAKRRLIGSGLYRWRLASRQGHGQPNPTTIPVGHEVVRRLARVIGGRPAGTWGEIIGMPMTAHFLGGCVMGESDEVGVVDAWHRVYGYDGLHIADGSVVPANPGVNPSLTITAMAERAFAYWPNGGEPDPRPAMRGSAGVPGEAPRAATPVVPVAPVVPAGVAGELAFPVGEAAAQP
jgi:cholesterol oxidase